LWPPHLAAGMCTSVITKPCAQCDDKGRGLQKKSTCNLVIFPLQWPVTNNNS
jgi:hypothetical protein